jgi:probable rRNA maturation factor
MNEGPVPKRAGPAGQPSEGPVVLVSNRQEAPVDEASLASLAVATLRSEGQAEDELSLSFVTAEEMEDLHVRYMHEPGPTDVLSFPMGEDGLLGDVVVCPEVAARNNADVEAELRLLVVHGVLHLLGYDHEEEEERRAMWAKQDAYVGMSS